MNAKRWIALAIFFILLFSLILNSATWQKVFETSEGWEIIPYREGKGEKIALIDLSGTISASSNNSAFLQEDEYSHGIFLDQIETAFTESTVKGIVLRVDSPGGTVNACDEIHQKIIKLKEEHDKPLIVYMDNIAASGAYLISTTGDLILANRNTFTGSIGVIMSTVNIHRLAEEWGISEEVFKSGEFKDTLNPFREITPEERAIFQDLIDESYNFFIESILESRDIEKDKLLKLADGRIYSGTQAYEQGLIDGIAFLDDAIDKTAELAGIKDPNVIHFVKIPPSTLDYFFSKINFPSFRTRSLEDLVYELKDEYPSIMYIWKP